MSSQQPTRLHPQSDMHLQAMRDRLLEKYEVQPPLKRVDSALRIAAISLVTSFILLRFVVRLRPQSRLRCIRLIC